MGIWDYDRKRFPLHSSHLDLHEWKRFSREISYSKFTFQCGNEGFRLHQVKVCTVIHHLNKDWKNAHESESPTQPDICIIIWGYGNDAGITWSGFNSAAAVTCLPKVCLESGCWDIRVRSSKNRVMDHCDSHSVTKLLLNLQLYVDHYWKLSKAQNRS